jgi:hypothetical protein
MASVQPFDVDKSPDEYASISRLQGWKFRLQHGTERLDSQTWRREARWRRRSVQIVNLDRSAIIKRIMPRTTTVLSGIGAAGSSMGVQCACATYRLPARSKQERSFHRRLHCSAATARQKEAPWKETFGEVPALSDRQLSLRLSTWSHGPSTAQGVIARNSTVLRWVYDRRTRSRKGSPPC